MFSISKSTAASKTRFYAINFGNGKVLDPLRRHRLNFDESFNIAIRQFKQIKRLSMTKYEISIVAFYLCNERLLS